MASLDVKSAYSLIERECGSHPRYTWFWTLVRVCAEDGVTYRRSEPCSRMQADRTLRTDSTYFDLLHIRSTTCCTTNPWHQVVQLCCTTCWTDNKSTTNRSSGAWTMMQTDQELVQCICCSSSSSMQHRCRRTLNQLVRENTSHPVATTARLGRTGARFYEGGWDQKVWERKPHWVQQRSQKPIHSKI